MTKDSRLDVMVSLNVEGNVEPYSLDQQIQIDLEKCFVQSQFH